MAAYRRVDGLKSPAVHRDQLQAQRLETSMGELSFQNVYLFTYLLLKG